MNTGSRRSSPGQRLRRPHRQGERRIRLAQHDHTDDFFLVLKGHLTIQLRTGRRLDEGELYVVPKGVEHWSAAEEEASVLLSSRATTVNTGDAGGPLTAEQERI